MAKKEKISYDDKGTTFKEAFAEARAEGKKTFEWNGEKYNTKLKDEKKKESEDKGIRDISESPRISDMKKVRDLALKSSNDAEERKDVVYKQEQARLSDLAKQGVVPEKEMRTSRSRLDAVNKTSERAGEEFMNRDMPLRRDAEARGKGDEYDGMKKGGVVKSSASKRGDGIAQRGKTRGRVC